MEMKRSVLATTVWFATTFTGFGLHLEEKHGIAPRAIIIFYWLALVVVVFIMEIHIMTTEWYRKSPVHQEMQMQPLSSADKRGMDRSQDSRPKVSFIHSFPVLGLF